MGGVRRRGLRKSRKDVKQEDRQGDVREEGKEWMVEGNRKELGESLSEKGIKVDIKYGREKKMINSRRNLRNEILTYYSWDK